ncbi:MAG TPA: transporter substrate-binding domain-containing protein [Balneolaceae bacterium]|nr:transporter substrate-binding domain-containing protein [Balneolaceae bacterium]
MRIIQFILLSFITVFLACGRYPKDARGTLEEALDDTLKVGVAVREGWVMVQNGEPRGREVLLAKAFADDLNATIDWLIADESELIPLLEKGKIHMLLGGFTQDSPWKSHVGFTTTYIKVDDKEHAIAVPPGENAFLMRLEQFLNEYKKGNQ